MRVDFTVAARADLQAIGDWIAFDNPARALTFIDELEQRALTLAQLPMRNPVARDTKRGPLRKCVHGRYQIYYLVLPDSIEIVSVRHSAQADPAPD